jgi:PTH1 family peptidyl-tRNA hydrolase
MKLIVGLGNPGKEYEKTRHNVGFWAVEELARIWGVDLSKKKFEAFYGEAKVAGEKVLLVLPQTYMNLSGKSVAAFLGFFKVEASDLAVVHDELDLPFGRLKVIREGRPAGHRGVASIQELLGTHSFCRFRIGIGRPPQKEGTVDFVLNSFSKEEKAQLKPIIKKTVEGLEMWTENGVDAAIQFCHQP